MEAGVGRTGLVHRKSLVGEPNKSGKCLSKRV
jgi:hypothetical protein